MAIYKHRRSFDSDPIKPLPREIEIGEIVINMANKTMWTKNDEGNVVSLTRDEGEIRSIIEADSDGSISSNDIVGFRIDSDAAGVRPVIFILRNDSEIVTDITTRGTNFVDPTADRDYANKKYVDDKIADVSTPPAGSVVHESELVVLIRDRTDLQSIVHESEIITVIRESDISFDSDNIIIRNTTIPRLSNKAMADILGNSPLVFTENSDGDERKLTGFRDSEGVAAIRSVAAIANSDGEFVITLVVFSPGFTPDGEGEGKLFWDIPAVGTQNFASPGVGIKVLVNGDNKLNETTDPFISSISGITVTDGDVSAFSTLDISGSDTGSASTDEYTLRAVVTDGESGSFFQPDTPTNNRHIGGSVSGTITFNQQIGSATETVYSGNINNNTWTLGWMNAGITFNVTDGTYNSARDDNTFLKVYNFSAIAYRSRPTGLSSTDSSAATGATISIVDPDTNYATLSVSSVSNGELDGVIQFPDPVDTETARVVTLNTTTSFSRPDSVTGTSYTASRSDNSESLLIPTFTYPRFFIITDRSDEPDLAVIIDDSTTTGIDINISQTDSAVTGDIASLGNTWDGTESTDSITITSGQPTSTIWFALPSEVNQPTNFERRGFVGFDVLENVHGLRGLRPDEVLEDLIPDDISDFSTGYTGHEYRFYGIDISAGETIIRIYN